MYDAVSDRVRCLGKDCITPKEWCVAERRLRDCGIGYCGEGGWQLRRVCVELARHMYCHTVAGSLFGRNSHMIH
jgi:hypothetical protein